MTLTPRPTSTIATHIADRIEALWRVNEKLATCATPVFDVMRGFSDVAAGEAEWAAHQKPAAGADIVDKYQSLIGEFETVITRILDAYPAEDTVSARRAGELMAQIFPIELTLGAVNGDASPWPTPPPTPPPTAQPFDPEDIAVGKLGYTRDACFRVGIKDPEGHKFDGALISLSVPLKNNGTVTSPTLWLDFDWDDGDYASAFLYGSNPLGPDWSISDPPDTYIPGRPLKPGESVTWKVKVFVEWVFQIDYTIRIYAGPEADQDVDTADIWLSDEVSGYDDVFTTVSIC